MSETMLSLGRSRRDDAPIELPAQVLLRHVMALGSSGSGKTVLCKVLVEEVVRHGLPALCIDPQGDLCSLALGSSDPEQLREHGIDPQMAEAFAENADVVVFTPGSATGVGLSVDPVNLVTEGMGAAERMHAITRTASILTGLLGYDPESDDGTGLAAVLDKCLQDLVAQGRAGGGLGALAGYLHELTPKQEQELSRYLDLRKIKTARQRLARLDVGARRMLFHEGAPIDIDMLLGLGAHAVPGRTRVAVVYLNSLHGQEDKDFFVATLVDQLYAWMLRNPSPQPQALFYIDEVAPFVPPVRKPAAKPGLQLLFKQARKYGLCCLMATQNPGDVDYKSMAQFGTWALGRLTTRQDLKKVEPTIKALLPTASDSVMSGLPALGPGQFVLISPDQWERPQELAVRWLLTPHETLDEARIEALADERWRERFADVVRGAERQTDATATADTPARESEESADLDDLDDPDDLGAADEAQSLEPEEADAPHTPVARMPAVQVDVVAVPPVRSGHTVVAPPPPTLTPQDAALAAPEFSEPETTSAPAPTPAAQAPAAQTPAARVDAPVNAPAAPVPAPPPAPAPDPVQERRDALAPWVRVLAQKKSMTLTDFATRAAIGERKARTLMGSMIELGLASMYPEGRKKLYWARSTGGRPDLGMPRKVTAARPLVDESTAWAKGHDMLRSKLLGLFGDDESLGSVQLVHRLVYRLEFEESVPRPLLQRVFGPTHDVRLGSVYLHPVSLDVLVFTADKGLRFVKEAGEYASAVQDLDGVVGFDEVAPGHLELHDEDWTTRKPPAEAKASFTARFSATPSKVSVVYVPVWRLTLTVGTGEGFRLVEIDGLAGRPVTWRQGG